MNAVPDSDGLQTVDTTERSAELPPWHGRRGRPSAAARAAWDAYISGQGPDPRVASPDGASGSPGTAVPLFAPVPKRPKEKHKKNLEGIERSIIALHCMIALRAKAPDMVIDADEAHLLAESGANILDYYKIKIDGKNGAILGMMYAVGVIYIPRAFAIYMSRDKAKTSASATGT